MKPFEHKDPICAVGNHPADPEELQATLVGHICQQHAELCSQAVGAAMQVVKPGTSPSYSGRLRKTVQKILGNAAEIENQLNSSL